MSKTSTYIYVKSFTLIELAVSLIISGLVIGFTMSAFLIISKIHNQYKVKTEKILEFEKMRYLLEKDNLESFEISTQGNGFTFQKDSSGILYFYTIDMLMRNQNDKIDTFELNDLKIDLSFNRETSNFNPLIDNVKISFQEDKVIILKKEYASKELMNLK